MLGCTNSGDECTAGRVQELGRAWETEEQLEFGGQRYEMQAWSGSRVCAWEGGC